MYVQPIGHIIVDVSDIIKNWVDQDIERKFYAFDKTKKTQEFIQYWRKKDWYVEYMCRKFEKMDLINSMGVFQARELDYADVYLECVTNLKPYCKLKGIMTQKKIGNELKTLFRKHVIPTTIMGDKIMSDKVEGILSYWQDYWDTKRKLGNLFILLETNKISQAQYDDESKLLIEMIPNIEKGAKEQEKELQLLSDLKKRFYDE